MAVKEDLRTVPLRGSLMRPDLIGGVERQLLFVAAMCSGITGFTLIRDGHEFIGIITGLSLWLAFMWVLIRLGKADPIMSKVYIRHVKYRSFYPAFGRFNAELKEYKPAR
jgi:type IV secretion system protein TrbD